MSRNFSNNMALSKTKLKLVVQVFVFMHFLYLNTKRYVKRDHERIIRLFITIITIL
jgi:hypothetical protein